MSARTHRIVIAVAGAGSCDEAQSALAEAAGAEIAGRGAVVACAGGGGIALAAAKGAKAAGGQTLGILPGASAHESPPNPHIDIAIFTGLAEGRTLIEIASADALLAVGGGFSTLAEIALALRAKKPVVLLESWRFEMNDARPNVPRAASASEAVALLFTALATSDLR
jgi:uncharacterized protein (TIGR00725 family)